MKGLTKKGGNISWSNQFLRGNYTEAEATKYAHRLSLQLPDQWDPSYVDRINRIIESSKTSQNCCIVCGNAGKVKCNTCGQFYCSKSCLFANEPFHKRVCAKTFPERLKKFLLLELSYARQRHLSCSLSKTNCQKRLTIVTPYTNHDSKCWESCEHCLLCHKPMGWNDYNTSATREVFTTLLCVRYFLCEKCLKTNVKLCTQTLHTTSTCPERLKPFRSKFRLVMLCCLRNAIRLNHDLRLLLWRTLLSNKNCKC